MHSIPRVMASRSFKAAAAAAGGFAAGGLVSTSFAELECAHTPFWGFEHVTRLIPLPIAGLPIPNMHAFDSRSLRRGFEVYRQVCSTCHSLKLIRFRELVGLIYTTEQAKALAQTYEIVDGPDDEGLMYERPAILADAFPGVYANDKAAAAANGGAIPPDLSLIAYARHGGEDYLFSLLTGYHEPPAGITVRPGLHWNAYFHGGAIGMPPPLMSEGIEYEDGTPATVAQQAKDVSTFLAWASDPKTDDRKYFGGQAILMLIAMTIGAGYYKRFKWSIVKNKKRSYI